MEKNSEIFCSSSAMRYAEVLFEMKLPKKAVEKARKIFSEVAQIKEILGNPTIRQEQKDKVIDRVFPEEIRNFLKVVCRRQKIDLIEEIFAAYDMRIDEEEKIVRADLFCTVCPSEDQQRGMETFLCKKYGAKQAFIDVQKDESLIGGFILRVGSDEFDRSVKGRLDRLEQTLIRR